MSICLEVSSHALDQNRLDGIQWLNSASILNIGEDHLDYHETFEDYLKTKNSIFKKAKVKIGNEANKLNSFIF